MRRARRFLPMLLVGSLFASGSASAKSSCAVTHSATAHEALGTFRVTACSTDVVEAKKYDEFLLKLKKFSLATNNALAGGWNPTEMLVSQARDACYKLPSSGVPLAKRALASLPGYRGLLDKLSIAFAELQQGAKVTDDRITVNAIRAALAGVDSALDLHTQAVNRLEAAANLLVGGQCSPADVENSNAGELVSHWLENQTNALLGLQKALDALYAKSGCKDAVEWVDPMSAPQINRTAGGGGTQTRKAEDLTILAPKQLKLKRRGIAKLPLTLNISGPGALEISSVQGKKLINVHITTFKQAGLGLLLKLPRGISAGNLQLKISFTLGGTTIRLKPTATLDLKIRAA